MAQIEVEKQGIRVNDSTIRGKISDKLISPSLITDLQQCPAKWVISNFLIQKQSIDAIRGTFFHSVMEAFFKYPASERTTDTLASIIPQTLDTNPRLAPIKEDSESIAWVKKAIDGYYQMGGNPRNVVVAQQTGSDAPALEMFVKSRIGDTKRKVLGFIDRLVEDKHERGQVIVEDWKTGKKAKIYNPNDKFPEGINERRQQIIYSLLLENEGYQVSQARLIYPVAKKIVYIDIHNPLYIDQVLQDIQHADNLLDKYESENFYPFIPSALCAWCPFAKACPVADIRSKSKFQEAYGSQPTVEEIEKIID